MLEWAKRWVVGDDLPAGTIKEEPGSHDSAAGIASDLADVVNAAEEPSAPMLDLLAWRRDQRTFELLLADADTLPGLA